MANLTAKQLLKIARAIAKMQELANTLADLYPDIQEHIDAILDHLEQDE